MEAFDNPSFSPTAHLNDYLATASQPSSTPTASLTRLLLLLQSEIATAQETLAKSIAETTAITVPRVNNEILRLRARREQVGEEILEVQRAEQKVDSYKREVISSKTKEIDSVEGLVDSSNPPPSTATTCHRRTSRWTTAPMDSDGLRI